MRVKPWVFGHTSGVGVAAGAHTVAGGSFVGVAPFLGYQLEDRSFNFDVTLGAMINFTVNDPQSGAKGGTIRKRDWESLRIALEDVDPADIAEILEDLPTEDSGLLFRVLPRDVAGVSFEYLPLDQQTQIVQHLGSEQMATVLNEMAPDDRTRLFEELPAEVTKRALEQLSVEEQGGSETKP